MRLDRWSPVVAAREFVTSRRGRVVVASHNDVDGLASLLILCRALAGSGSEPVPLPGRRGEHVHQDGMRKRMQALEPDALVVLDMGSRSDPILDDVPTLVIDHHVPRGGGPRGAVFVNGHDRDPVPPTSVLAWAVCRGLPGTEGCAWLAALGAIADLGTAAPFTDLLGIVAKGSAWTKAVSLLNAARRAPQDDVFAALEVLERASSPQEISAGRVPGVAQLEEYRRAVQAELARCSRVAPKKIGPAALIRFSSAAQVHPLVAVRWSGRLAPAVVIAANDGFLPGRVNFAIRAAADIDLVAWLRGLPFTPSTGAEFANGHPRATGGSLPTAEFERFLEVLSAAAKS